MKNTGDGFVFYDSDLIVLAREAAQHIDLLKSQGKLPIEGVVLGYLIAMMSQKHMKQGPLPPDDDSELIAHLRVFVDRVTRAAEAAARTDETMKENSDVN